MPPFATSGRLPAFTAAAGRFFRPRGGHEVEDARRFIKAYRAEWQSRPAQERLAAPAAITRTVYALGPNVRLQRIIMRLRRDAEGNDKHLKIHW